VYKKSLDEFGSSMTKHINSLSKDTASRKSIKIIKLSKKFSEWEKEALTIIPERTYFGTLFLADIPVEKWREVKSSPHWWSATNWASASYWWCDGKRNLNEIKKLVEMEAGKQVTNFDLINYYKFLEEYKLVRFVKK